MVHGPWRQAQPQACFRHTRSPCRRRVLQRTFVCTWPGLAAVLHRLRRLQRRLARVIDACLLKVAMGLSEHGLASCAGCCQHMPMDPFVTHSTRGARVSSNSDVRRGTAVRRPNLPGNTFHAHERPCHALDSALISISRFDFAGPTPYARARASCFRLTCPKKLTPSLMISGS
jgi:hypothetical protein